MKTSTLHKFFVTGLALAGLTLAPGARADVEVFFVGGNASQTVLFDRATNILSGLSVVISPTNSSVRTYTGTISGQPGLGNVTIDFAQLGAVGGLQDVVNQNNNITATSNSLPPTVAVSSTAPEAVGIDPSPFVQTRTLVIPFVFVKNSVKSPNLAGVTNLTQRQAAYLEGASGTLPSAFFGGSSTTDIVYLVARNTAAAVRTEIDANVYFTGTISTWATNQASFAVLGPPYNTTPIGSPVPDRRTELFQRMSRRSPVRVRISFSWCLASG